tara:strand:+ start:58 stop:687 length:630 start_codon:yes stop_codon:yes gene_type:complete
MGVVGAVGEQGAAEQATSSANRAKLKKHERDNWNYLTQATLDNARWKNDVQIADVKYDNIYMAMQDQWIQQDKQLDAIFAKSDYKIEKAIRKMYENDYAGTQTGRTAARLAAKPARELGYEKSQALHEKMMAKEEGTINKERYKGEAERRQWDVYDQIRFTPIHGHAPPPPMMEAPPSRAGMFLSIGSSIFSGFADAGAFTPTKIEATP